LTDQPALVRERLQNVLLDRLGPEAAYLLRDVVAHLPGSNDLERRLAARLEIIEQALALQRDWHRVRPAASTWISYGDPVWLVGEAAGSVMAARAAEPGAPGY
jgi:hypothetical protein